MNFCPNCGHDLNGVDPGSAPVQIVANHDPVKCNWRRTGDRNGRWECEHGFVVFQHPRGYCDSGCCR